MPSRSGALEVRTSLWELGGTQSLPQQSASPENLSSLAVTGPRALQLTPGL